MPILCIGTVDFLGARDHSCLLTKYVLCSILRFSSRFFLLVNEQARWVRGTIDDTRARDKGRRVVTAGFYSESAPVSLLWTNT